MKYYCDREDSTGKPCEYSNHSLDEEPCKSCNAFILSDVSIRPNKWIPRRTANERRRYLQLEKELSALNQTFQPLNVTFSMGDKGYSYDSIYPDAFKDYIHWAKVFIRLGDVTIGRITYKFVHDEMRRYYIKQYKPFDYAYDDTDKIFYHLDYFFVHGHLIPNYDALEKESESIRDQDFAEKLAWRKDHPLKPDKKVTRNGKVFHTHRKKLVPRNIRGILGNLVRELIKREAVSC